MSALALANRVVRRANRARAVRGSWDRISYLKAAAIDSRTPINVQPIEVSIRCSGKIHRVVFRERGDIALLDHSKSEIRALRSLRELGDTTCKCLAMLDLMKGGVEPSRRELRPAWFSAQKARRYRFRSQHPSFHQQNAKKEAVGDRLARYRGRAASAAAEALGKRTRYGKLAPGCEDSTISVGGSVSCPTLFSGQTISTHGETSIRVETEVSVFWPQMDACGLGVVDGHLALAYYGTFEGNPVVMLAYGEARREDFYRTTVSERIAVVVDGKPVFAKQWASPRPLSPYRRNA